jgi:hypothetical protein
MAYRRPTAAIAARASSEGARTSSSGIIGANVVRLAQRRELGDPRCVLSARLVGFWARTAGVGIAISTSLACGRIGFEVRSDGGRGDSLGADACAFGPWSTPVPLAVVNSALNEEYSPALTNDGLSLFFLSNRPGAGDFDVWEATRASDTLPFELPVNVASLNTSQREDGVEITGDGLTLYYCTVTGPQCPLLRTTRATRSSSFPPGQPVGISDGWGPHLTDDGRELYYTTTSGSDQLRRAVVAGDVVTDTGPVVELNVANNQGFATTTADHRTIYFSSDVAELALDLVHATRGSVESPFDAPMRDAALSAPGAWDTDPELSHDDRTILFASDRGGAGNNDLYIATRSCQ